MVVLQITGYPYIGRCGFIVQAEYFRENFTNKPRSFKEELNPYRLGRIILQPDAEITQETSLYMLSTKFCQCVFQQIRVHAGYEMLVIIFLIEVALKPAIDTREIGKNNQKSAALLYIFDMGL